MLGDLGHSPRMCYHALSFSKLDYYVNLCGYVETEPSHQIVDDVNIDIIPIEAIKTLAICHLLCLRSSKLFDNAGKFGVYYGTPEDQITL